MKQALRIDFVRFGLVGASGFAVNFVLLSLLYKIWHMPVFIAQLISAEVALFSNFTLHNHWTYRHHTVTKTISQLLVQFHATSWVAIVGSAFLASFLIDMLRIGYIQALVIVAVVSLSWNFVATKFYVWRHERQPTTEIKEGT